MDALLDAIYSAAIDTDQWPVALNALSSAFRACSALLIVTDVFQAGGDLALVTGLAATPRLQQEYQEKWINNDPGLAYFKTLKTGAVAITSQVWTAEERFSMPFHRDFFYANGHLDSMCAALDQGGGRVGLLALVRGREESEFGDEDAARYLVLVPHLRRALQLHGEFAGRSRRGNSLAAIVEGMDCGAIIIGASGDVLFANEAARRVIARGDKFAMTNGRLRIINDMEANATFDACLAGVFEGRIDAAGGRFLIDRGRGTLPYGIIVSPLPPSPIGFGATDNRSALIIINEAHLAPASAVAAVAAHFRLTPSESALLKALLEGQSMTDHAVSRGVAPNTIRFHAKRLYAKTGTAGQADLVRVALAIARTLESASN